MDFKVLISGSRDGCDINIIHFMIHYVIENIPHKQFILIHGDAPGVDTQVKNYCLTLGWQIIAYPADWQKHGKKAGPLRNQKMVDTNPDFGLFIPSLQSKGTIDCYQRFLKIDKPGLLYNPQDHTVIEI